MIEADHLHGVDGARLAAAAGVVVDAFGLCVSEAFEWVMDLSTLTGIPVPEIADLVVLAAVHDEP
jgi:hypothetical protein